MRANAPEVFSRVVVFEGELVFKASITATVGRGENGGGQGDATLQAIPTRAIYRHQLRPVIITGRG